MTRGRRERRIIAATGAVAIVVVAANLIISAINAHKKKKQRKKELPCSSVQVNLSASEILMLADQVIAKSKAVHDSVASIPLNKATYMNVIAPIAELEAQQFPLVQSCVFPKMVSVSDDVRKASAEAERKLDDHFLLCRKREDVYRVIKAFAERGEWLSPEAKRYVKYLMKDFERHGANLTLNKREELDRLRTRIDELNMQYIQNLNEDSSFLLFSESELAGMPAEFIKGLKKDENGKLKVTLKSWHVSPVLDHCKVGATRKVVAGAHGQRCGKENLFILENLVRLRHKYARLLGYSNYSDYALESKMVKSSIKVFEFLEDISGSLTDLATKELNLLKDFKRKEEGDSPFGIEDLLYYMRRVEERKFDLDLGIVKQYFPVKLVVSGVFKIFQDLLGLIFEEIEETEVWHGTVRLFSVLDFTSHELLGYFYLDIFSREGKYGHACVVALQNSYFSSNGNRQVQKQVDGDEGLLRFSEVVSLFHEFMHVVHHICNRATFSRFSSLRIDGDFVEIPGRMMENWCYESLSLKLISGFHQDITKPITIEMCRSLKKRRDSFSGLKLKQEILFCLIDQVIHSNDNIDIVELLKNLHPKVMLGLPLLEGTNPATCFPRLAIGYEAASYSCIWSEVFAADVFASKFQDDILSQHAGLLFRNKVLAPGGSKDPSEILSDYLGREPSIQAFIECKTRNSLI